MVMRRQIPVAGAALLLTLGTSLFDRSAAADAAAIGSVPLAPASLADLPLTFTENGGQAGAAARYVAAVPGATVEFNDDGVTYRLHRVSAADALDSRRPGREEPATLPGVDDILEITTRLVGASTAPPLGERRAAHETHVYFGADPTRWRTGLASFEALRCAAVYPGVDLVYRGNGRRLEYDFHLAPGADPRRIAVRYDGVLALRVTGDGALVLATRFGEVREEPPVAWQELPTGRREVPVAFRLVDARTVGFSVIGPLDPAASLVIDPVINYSTYLGGSTFDEAHEIACNAAGGAWVVGGTLSPNFPAAGAPVPGAHYSVFLSRLNPAGTALVFSVFLGGSEDQIGYGLEVDSSGNAYICGTTGSNDFPTTVGAYDTSFNGANSGVLDMFMAKFSPTGTLLYSTYLGGSGSDTAARLALGLLNTVYVVGNVGSTDWPTTAGCYDATANGASDIGVALLDPVGGGASDLLYSTYLGGNDYDEAHDVSVDIIGVALIAGATRSSDFPSTVGPVYNGTFDAFAARLTPGGGGAGDLLFAYEIGGTGQDYGMGIGIDNGFETYLAGITASTNFPTTTGAYQTAYAGGPYDGFVTRFTFGGASVYSTFLGGPGSDRCEELAMDNAFNAVAIGSTESPAFPTTANAYDATHNGASDIFIAGLSRNGAHLLYGSFLGGSQPDHPYGFKIDPAGRIYVTGTTESSDYPATAGAYDTGYNGGPIDGVITKFVPNPPESCAVCVSPADTCCAQPPQIEGMLGQFGGNAHVLVGTREPNPGNVWPWSVVVYNLNSPPAAEDTDWAAVQRYTGPGTSWSGDSLGTVFGLTLDDYGNIFVTHTSCYSADRIGGIANAGPGAVYRIDGTTGAVNVFCRLPNYPDPNVAAGENLPGLGNISYDCRNRQFFVTNLEDGRIYRIQPTGPNAPTGTIVQVFDPFVADTGPTNYLTPIGSVPSPGWAPYGERLWGVQWHMDRVYYGVWVEDSSNPTAFADNEMRSVGLSPSGAFLPASDRHELYVPPLNALAFSHPVSDISFDANGRMLLGERGISFDTYSESHFCRVLEYVCSGGCWVPGNPFGVGDYFNNENSAGGVDYDHFPYTGSPIGRVWASGDALHLFNTYPDAVYGYQGFRPTGGPNTTTSMLIDSDSIVNGAPDKTYIGDVEVPGCPNLGVGDICGIKYLDLNRNGIKDGSEPGLAGWGIQLTGGSGTVTTFTAANGSYCFTWIPPGNYTLSEVGQPGYVQTGPPGGTWSVTLAGGQTLTGRDFGNYSCTGSTSACVGPPPGMGAWWSFAEPTSSTIAADITHMSPIKNTMQLVGGAQISTNGQVGNGLCMASELDYARVPAALQQGIDFGTGSFAIDAWLNMANGGGPRIIAEKRALVSSTPYRTRGWAVSLNGLQLSLEIGTGVNTQIVPGPTLPASTWAHFAVSVDRAAGTGRWYLNGVAVPAFDFTPITGSLWNTADVYLGRPSPPFGFGASFEGCLDELELFTSPLSAAAVAGLYAAGAAGKCREFCRVPQITSICKDRADVTVCVNICNATATPQTYQWSVAGNPVGPGCTVNGPTLFTPAMGSITVPANSCSAPICITIKRPVGLTAQNATSCFTFTFVNSATGSCSSCIGTIRADNTCWCATPVQTGIVSVGQRFAPGLIGVPIDIGIGNPCNPTTIPYRIVARFERGDLPDPHLVSLNGLPPGEPVFGTFVPDPLGEGVVTTYLSFPDGYAPFAPYQLVLEADTDGDGLMDELSSTCIESVNEPDDPAATPVTDAASLAPRLLATPNPFLGGARILLTLPAAADAELSVYDLSGRRVRTLHRGRLEAGTGQVEWNGRDDWGRETAGGIYFIRLVAGTVRVQSKIVKLR